MKEDVRKLIQATMLPTEEYAVRRPSYREPPGGGPAKRTYRQDVDTRMTKLAQLIIQAEAVGADLTSQQHKLSVLKWMSWRAKPTEIQRKECKANIALHEERIVAILQRADELNIDM
eukprot:3690646-Pyramimonas_sp.AAC.1